MPGKIDPSQPRRPSPSTQPIAAKTPVSQPVAPQTSGGIGGVFQQAKEKLVNTTGGRHKPVPAGELLKAIEASKANAKSLVTQDTGVTKLGASSGFGKKSGHGRITADQWKDPTKLVGQLTQYPAKGAKSAVAEAACGAANLLGATLLTGGPSAAAAMLKRTASNPNLSANEKKQLEEIASKVEKMTASLEDLNSAQQLLYKSANTEASLQALKEQAAQLKPGLTRAIDKAMREYVNATPLQKDATELNRLLTQALGVPVDVDKAIGGMLELTPAMRAKDTSGLTDAELSTLAKTAAPGATRVSVGDDPSVEALAKSLKPGESMTLRIAGEEKSGEADHYVTLGRRADGQYFLYNPDPGKGDSTLVVGQTSLDQRFLSAITAYDDRFRNEGSSFPDALKYSPGSASSSR